jgi:hypothetical protein
LLINPRFGSSSGASRVKVFKSLNFQLRRSSPFW